MATTAAKGQVTAIVVWQGEWSIGLAEQGGRKRMPSAASGQRHEWQRQRAPTATIG